MPPTAFWDVEPRPQETVLRSDSSTSARAGLVQDQAGGTGTTPPGPPTAGQDGSFGLPQFPPPRAPVRRETLAYVPSQPGPSGSDERGGGSGSTDMGGRRGRMSSPVPGPSHSAGTGPSSAGSSAEGASGGVMGTAEELVYALEDGQEGTNGGEGPAGSKPQAKGGVNPGLTSCGACRRGKRRCEPTPLVPASHPDAAKLPCARCRRFALECVRIQVPRRKGPAKVDLSAYSDAVNGFAPPSTGHSGGSGAELGLLEMSATPAQPPGPTPLFTPTVSGGIGAGGSGGIQEWPGPVDRRRSSAMSGEYGARELDYGYASASYVRGGSQVSDPSPVMPGLTRASSSHLAPIPDSLDQVTDGTTVNTIIKLFFDYVYPLTPCLHRPTFLADLAARRDKTDPIFFALTLTVLASTLVQVPRNLINMDKEEVEHLARVCVKVARAKIGFVFEESIPVEISFIVISYLEGIVHLLLGNNTAHVMCTANANQLALAMRLNEEASYEGLDPIESEIRRRTYWLLFQADKSAACMRARTINLRLEDAASLRLPAEVDDEQITHGGITMQAPGRTSIIAGFNVVTNLFRIMNDALLLQRRKAPPTVDSILADLQNVNNLREKVIDTTKHVAPKLQLHNTMDSRVSSPAHDWEAKLEARFLDYFHSAGDGPSVPILNSFLVLQGNILVTQSVVRLVLLHSKEALLSQLAAITQMPAVGLGNLAGMQATEPAEDIACELLDGLNSLPVECVATNGPSLVQKVRFVAIQLMECSIAPSSTTARAQKLLMQFLSVLSVIEGMYTFGRDISAE